MDKIKRIQELVSQLNMYRNEYYNLNKPSISDLEYDNLFDELTLLENETKYILSNSPTQTVGYEVKSKLTKVEHPIPLKSLHKTKSVDDLKNFIGNKDSLLMLKADGLTVELLYENQMLIQASTRGNSEIGEDITHCAKTFKNIPLSIPFRGKLRIAGEAVIHWDDFNELNLKLPEEQKYKTPRNLCSGSVRQLNSKICSERNVYFYSFAILEGSEKLTDSKNDNFKWLQNQGFEVIKYFTISNSDSMECLQDNIMSLKKYAEINNIPIDGLVATFNSLSYSNSLSETTHHPLHSLAYKFFDDSIETTLRNVEWNTTRTGQVNPVGIFDTVIIDGTEIGRASLHNLSFIEDLQLNIGCTILVSKRNLIIPHIEDNLDRNKGILEYPKYCPSCGKETIVKNTGTADFLFCTNKNCPAQQLDKFINFVKRDAMNIEGLSEATLEKFLNLGLIKTFADIYGIDKYKNKIIGLEGFGGKSYNNLITSIEKSKNVKLENFINALGIEGVGLSTAKLLAKKFKNIQNFINVKYVDLVNIEGIGNITTQSIINYIEENINDILDLVNYVSFVQEERKENKIVNNPFNGKKVYATGVFANYKKEEIQKLLESLGAKFANGYAKSLDYLIVGSIKGSGKEDKAKKDGVKILGEEEFVKIINQE